MAIFIYTLIQRELVPETLPQVVFRPRTVSSIALALLILASSFCLMGPSARASTLTAHAPINITGDSKFTAANGVTGGSGTSLDPFVISGLSINSTSAMVCIEITNTSSFYMIRNVEVDCGGYSTPTSIALKLQATSNGKILSSYFHGWGQSVEIDSSNNISFSNNSVYTESVGFVLANDTNTSITGNQVGNAPSGQAVFIRDSRMDVFSGNTVFGGGCGAQSCTGNGPALEIDRSSSITISNNQISSNYPPSCVLRTYGSLGLRLLNNTVQSGDVGCGIGLNETNSTVISGNRVTGPGSANDAFANIGLSIYGSRNDIVSENNVTMERTGIALYSTATGTLVYHNNLVNNLVQASDNNPGKNQWDNGYPSGGNYWSDYKGVDNCRGFQQSICPSPDGIGDIPYAFNTGQDKYPLMKPFNSHLRSQAHSPILIAGNDGFTPANGVTGGTGIVSDPYMIQGWSINLCWNCYPTSIGIRIANTTAYFEIINVSVSDQNQGSASNGIVLNNVTNGRIDSSFVDVESAFNGPGIIVASSRNVIVNANNVVAGGCTGADNCSHYDTIGVYSSSNVTVSENSIKAYASGPVLNVKGSSNVIILHNTVNTGFEPPLGGASGPANGIVVSSSGNVRISQNSVINSACGESIVIGGSSSLWIFENNVTVPGSGSCRPYFYGNGIVLQSTTGAQVYHNNLVNNTPQASDDNPGKNQWDNGYPSGGNYWSDYKGIDNCSGPQQNICPNPDGIGDTPYAFTSNQDRYPLMKPHHLDTLVSAVLGADGQVYASATTPNGMWLGWQFLGLSSSSSPVLCSGGPGGLYLAARGSDDASIYIEGYTRGSWSQLSSPGGATNAQPACGSMNGALDLVVRGLDNALYYNSLNEASGRWSGWQYLGGYLAASPVLVASTSQNRLDVMVQGGSSSIWHKAFVNGVWSDWDSPGGATPDTPAAASDGSLLHVVVRGVGNTLWYDALSFTTGVWSGWQSLGGATFTTPSLASDSNGTVHLLVVGMDDGIYDKSLPSGRVWSSSWDSPGGATNNPIASIALGPDLAIMVRGMDGQVWSNTFSSSTWQGWTGLGGAILTAPALYNST